MYEAFFDTLLHHPDQNLVANGKVRRELLQIIIKYYQLHVEKLGEIRSLQVLSEVLSE
jgi:DNA repair protein RecO (recombination protein O)